MVWRVLVLALASASTATAQGAAVSGVVFDSLVTAAPLRAAEVWLVNTPHRAVTDSSGRFRIEGVGPGRYQARVFHPLLDSLALTGPAAEFETGGVADAKLQLALPSERSVFARVCGRPPAVGEGLTLGLVLDLEEDRPAPGARVTARWIEYAVEKRSGASRFVRAPRELAAAADPAGQFALCGVPNDIGLEVEATFGDRATSPLTVFLAERVVAFRQLFVAAAEVVGAAPAPPAPAASAPAAGPAARAAAPAPARTFRRGSLVLHGRVVTTAGRPVADAVIAAERADASTRTDSSGGFRLGGLPAGSQEIIVRSIGFAPAARTVTVRRADSQPVTVTLDPAALALPTIAIVGERESRWDRTGFETRRWQGAGKFMTAQDIQGREATGVTDLLRSVPGLEVVRVQYEDVLVVHRAGRPCRPDVFLDGNYVPDGASQLTYLVRSDRIVGLEVYTGVGAPGEFIRNLPPCGSVVIWTTWSNRP